MDIGHAAVKRLHPIVGRILFCFFFLRRLLAQQAAAFLALISRSAAEDKNQPPALFSLQPVSAARGIYEMIIFDGLDVRRTAQCFPAIMTLPLRLAKGAKKRRPRLSAQQP